MFKKYISFLLTFLLVCFSLAATPLPTLHADAAILIEPKTNTILYAKNANERFYPASTTKILTSLILLEDMPLDTPLIKTVSSTANVPADSSHIGIRVGEQYTALEGIYAIMLASDNFVSYDMAVKHSGNIRAFADRMNAKAKSVGAFSSHFVNPHGYHDPYHYTTPFDLSQIAKAAFSHPKFTEIAGSSTHMFVTQNNKRTIPLRHTAPLLDQESPLYNPHVIGAKTGFHTPAKRTLISKATYNNIDLIGVVMRTDNPLQFQDMNTLFEYGMQNYSVWTDEIGTASLINHSYSSWAKPYIDFALEQEWIIDTTKNYTETITRREFVNLLKNIVPSEYSFLLDNYIDYEGQSIYTENLKTNFKEISSIYQSLLNDLSLTSTYVPVITNLINYPLLSNPYKEVVDLIITEGMQSQNNATLTPDTPITYEQAIALTYRLNPIMKLYNSYSLIGLSHLQ
ncbi:D-alanyl-D-alanine carboxypeptidase family protein [Cellulosilyticum sp. I15G10I2]|uniref:D-alanyl-D-alanine carboxypeptidase family protein n=1 Tax=Cellulosilyticum sp. I15G10I2 TaxID=1892843 RepID=UPI00085C1C3E|nr:D-alanyl-D-alanine carboxypeptidase [Cellulosilyticum sp. I15G10I2]